MGIEGVFGDTPYTIPVSFLRLSCALGPSLSHVALCDCFHPVNFYLRHSLPLVLLALFHRFR